MVYFDQLYFLLQQYKENVNNMLSNDDFSHIVKHEHQKGSKMSLFLQC